MFLRSSPLSTLFCALLPVPHVLAIPTPSSPCAGHQGSARPRPALPQPNPTLPRPRAGHRPHLPCPAALDSRLAWPHLARPRMSAISPTPPSSARPPPGSAMLFPGRRPRPTQQCLLVTRPGPALPPLRRAQHHPTPPRPTLPSPSCRWPVPASICSSSESRAPLCIKFFS
jgi:hypothetical protein